MTQGKDERVGRQSHVLSRGGERALEVAQGGVPVFPCQPSTKKPFIQDWPHEASTDPQAIRQWWESWPDALIGVPTGVRTGLVAVDIDPEGAGWFQANRARLGAYRLHQTKRGKHLLYEYPSSGEVRNSTDALAEGVDVRGEGGYIIWWPAHAMTALGERGALPPWLHDSLVKRRIRRLNGHAFGDTDWAAERPRVIQALAQLDPDLSHDEWRDVASAISWASGGGPDGEDVFVEFSKGKYWKHPSDKFPGEEQVRKKYRSFKNDKERNVTLATLYKMAKDGGGYVPKGRPDKKANGHDPHSKLLLVRADNQEEERVDWLWKGFLARNKFHLLTGSGGVMKSTLAVALAATVTTQGEWPDGSRCERAGSVLIWSGEDDLADTVRPRLRYAGADLKKCYFITGVKSRGERRDFDLSTDCEALDAACKRIGDVALIVVDPIVTIVQKDNNSASDVRRSLQPLIALGMRYDAVILGLQHFTKGSRGRDPAERVLGSGAWVQASRITLACAPVAEGDGKVSTNMVFACVKTFYKMVGGYEYTFEEEPVTEIARIRWGRYIEGTGQSIVSEAEGDAEGKSRLGDAKGWLRDVLRDGPVPYFQIGMRAIKAGIRPRTLRRAQESLNLVSVRENGKRCWKLP